MTSPNSSLLAEGFMLNAIARARTSSCWTVTFGRPFQMIKKSTKPCGQSRKLDKKPRALRNLAHASHRAHHAPL